MRIISGYVVRILMERISRDNARKLGLKLYFTGEPCMRGHVCARRVASYDCVECMRLPLRAAAPERARLRNQYFRSKYRTPDYELVRQWRAERKAKRSATGAAAENGNGPIS
jgi:hypothetical protein